MGLALVVDPAMGMSGNMFVSGVVSMGAPADLVCRVMESTARSLGRADVHVETVATVAGSGTRLRVELETHEPVLSAADACMHLEEAIRKEQLRPAYAGLARRALENLITAEREAHSGARFDAGQLELQAIGVAHTPW